MGASMALHLQHLALQPLALLPGAHLRQALQVGVWKALADGSDRAAMRATCTDARGMADELVDTAVLRVGPGTWDLGGAVATYHRRLGAVRSLRVVCGAGGGNWDDWDDDEPHAVHFMEAYCAALGAALHAADCRIVMLRHTWLPAALVAGLLQRVAPHVERLDIELGGYGNQEQLLLALEPRARLGSLRLLPFRSACGWPGLDEQGYRFGDCPGDLAALCRLPRTLHTLSGPWGIKAQHLESLCSALPSLTTLGFQRLSLAEGTGRVISLRLHTLAAWWGGADPEVLRLDLPWLHMQRNMCSVDARNLLAALRALRRLSATALHTFEAYAMPRADGGPAIQAAAQRFAACADHWAWVSGFMYGGDLQAECGLPGSLAALKHVVMMLPAPHDANGVSSALGSLVSASPNMSTLGLQYHFAVSTETLAAMLQPLRRAAQLHALVLLDYRDYPDVLNDEGLTATQQAALLEGVVRCLVQPGAGGTCNEHCSALRHVLLHRAQPDALAACIAALARDGICVAVSNCDLSMFWRDYT